nr:MAG TPA: hypothetical protein [Caudoviricetes sp.]
MYYILISFLSVSLYSSILSFNNLEGLNFSLSYSLVPPLKHIL